MAAVVIPLPADVTCVLFALRRESMYFRRAHRPLRQIKSASCYAALAGTHPRPILLVETGVGQPAVDTALDWLFTAVARPGLIIYAGFAGALDPQLQVGDALVAETIVDATGCCWHPSSPVRSCAGVQAGRLFTADRLIATPDEKRRLAAQHGARMVDMEAAHAAARCRSAAIPFCCIRAISDRAGTQLSPSLVALLAGGRVSAAHLAASLCRTPTLLRELCRLGRDTRIAARQLALALDRVLAASITAGVEDRQNRSSGPTPQAGRTTMQPTTTAGAEHSGGDGWPLGEK